MKSVIQGAAITSSQAPTLHLGTFRRTIMVVLSADVFTPAERVLANHNVYECEDAAKLALWLKNVHRVFTEREAETVAQTLANMAKGIERFETIVATLPAPDATAIQTSEVHKLALHRTIADGERTQVLLKLPRLDHAQAQALIGELWAKILLRTGGASGPATGNVSYSS